MIRILLSLYFLLMITLPSWAYENSASENSSSENSAQENYMKIDDYIVAALGKSDIQPEIIWVTRDIKPEISKILQRSIFPLRYRFYRQGNRTVWILDEIGKVMPITTGITIENNTIINLTVLTYRESHGSEIRFPAYSNQYNTVYLTEDMNLSQPINGISGATLSTNAMKKVSRLALYLHKKVMEKNVPTPDKK